MGCCDPPYSDATVSQHPLLPLADQPPEPRRDAARNRTALLDAAERLVAHCGTRALTMDALAAEAGVGKGTVFRHFTSREGLMAALLDASETEFQDSLIRGEPPLGPGAPPLDRLLAFGRARIDATLLHAELIAAAGRAGARSYAAYSFTAAHVRYLLGELHAPGDHRLLATILLAPLEAPILVEQVQGQHLDPETIWGAWADVVRRVVAPA